MNKNTIAIAMLVAGIALLNWGFSMSEAFGSKVSRVFSGSPTDKAMWDHDRRRGARRRGRIPALCQKEVAEDT